MQHTTQVVSVARDGTALGVKIGALVSLLYVGGYLLLILIDPLYRPLVPTILLIGGIAGVVPATVIGMITGWCIGRSWNTLRSTCHGGAPWQWEIWSVQRLHFLSMSCFGPKYFFSAQQMLRYAGGIYFY